MPHSEWLRGRLVYAAVIAMLAILIWVILDFQRGAIGYEAARVYVQALTAAATLALLYYAYFNVASKREEDIARLELAVRPVLVWELESSDGGARLQYKTIKHPLYDFRAALELGGKKLEVEDRHLDVAEANAGNARARDVAGFISSGMGGRDMRLLRLTISYHSETGGKYEFLFTKEVLKKKHGFSFRHRKIVSAKYPWRSAPVGFED